MPPFTSIGVIRQFLHNTHLTNQPFVLFHCFPQEIPINGVNYKSSIRYSTLPKMKCWENAKSQSFYARDNVCNFLKWCRKFGVRDAVIFERYINKISNFFNHYLLIRKLFENFFYKIVILYHFLVRIWYHMLIPAMLFFVCLKSHESHAQNTLSVQLRVSFSLNKK
jgi:hypothetical protein